MCVCAVMCDISYVNQAHVINQNPRVTAINSCIEVDLTGQVCADSIGTRMYSGLYVGPFFSDSVLSELMYILARMQRCCGDGMAWVEIMVAAEWVDGVVDVRRISEILVCVLVTNCQLCFSTFN